MYSRHGLFLRSGFYARIRQIRGFNAFTDTPTVACGGQISLAAAAKKHTLSLLHKRVVF